MKPLAVGRALSPSRPSANNGATGALTPNSALPIYIFITVWDNLECKVAELYLRNNHEKSDDKSIVLTGSRMVGYQFKALVKQTQQFTQTNNKWISFSNNFDVSVGPYHLS